MKMIDKDYFALDLLSYSKLAAFDRVGPSLFNDEKKDDSSSAIRVGSLVDDILTDPDGIEEKYFIVSIDKPTASLGVLVDLCTQRFNTFEEIAKPLVFEMAKTAELWSSTKKDEVYETKFDTDHFWNYLKMHYQRAGRDMVSQDTLELARKMARTLKEDIDTKDAFLEEEGVEVIYQHVELWGVEKSETFEMFGGEAPFEGYKSKFDILRIDHNNKTLQFVDIKTMMDKADAFERSFYMFRYYIQDAMYQDALLNLKMRKYPEYSLLDPYNIVCSSIEPEKAYKFDIDPKWMAAGREGFKLGNKSFKGYHDLTTEVRWHRQTKVYNYTRQEFYSGRVKAIPFHGQLK